MIAEGLFMRVLLTGFQPFGDLTVNPSQCIVEHFQAQQRDDLITQVLPTEYQRAGECIQEAIRDCTPDAVISLGVAQRRQKINLERIAVNVDDASVADNAGILASGEMIAPDGPVAYWSTLPLTAMRAALEEQNIPVTLSNHAGAYICNHAFYTARHTLEALGRSIPCGFIHVPDLAKVDGETSSGLPLEVMIEAVTICLAILGMNRQEN
jgi:pyroglutamyl-peptidase